MDMSDRPFSNREINEMFKDVKESLFRIEGQTTRHNGRMTKIEEWKAYMTGGMAVLTLIVMPILGWALYVLVNINDKVDDSIREALSVYDITTSIDAQ